MITTGRHRVVQVHPTLRCNLRCLHCYSDSGPGQRLDLEASIVAQALTDARELGYTVAGFSGGEPLIYRDLPKVLAHARQLGMVTTVTTNGLLLDRRRLESLRELVELLAISLDGVPASHDRMRARDGAFEAMARRLEAVRSSGIAFGFIFTLTQHNVHELDWVARFALDQGADLLQVHPLEEAGRAMQMLLGATPHSIELGFALAETRRLQELTAGRLVVHLDVATVHALQELVMRSEERLSDRLADVVSPLVVEADGTVVPLQYGFSRRFALGTLRERRLSVLAMAWLADREPAYRDLFVRAAEVLDGGGELPLPLVNPYEVIARLSIDDHSASETNDDNQSAPALATVERTATPR